MFTDNYVLMLLYVSWVLLCWWDKALSVNIYYYYSCWQHHQNVYTCFYNISILMTISYCPGIGHCPQVVCISWQSYRRTGRGYITVRLVVLHVGLYTYTCIHNFSCMHILMHMLLTKCDFESVSIPVYDDYKFVSRKELEELGLAHLIGSNLLRAYMHGFFVDIRLYRKVSSRCDQ